MARLIAGPHETNIKMCEFHQLVDALWPLHLGDKAHVARLHDVWKLGAVTPDSIILAHEYNSFDERALQRHAKVRRIVLPTPLAAWMVEVSRARGMVYTFEQAYAIACGNASMMFGKGTEG